VFCLRYFDHARARSIVGATFAEGHLSEFALVFDLKVYKADRQTIILAEPVNPAAF